jgi:uncharacterized membrane protein
VLRVAAQGRAVGPGEEDVDDSNLRSGRFDWTGFVLSSKGVSLEGLEVAVMVVALGGASGALGSAVLGAAAAVIVLAAFGTLWAGQGLGVSWPGGELARW